MTLNEIYQKFHPISIGNEVWEFIATFKALGESYDKLKETYHWLSRLRAPEKNNSTSCLYFGIWYYLRRAGKP